MAGLPPSSSSISHDIVEIVRIIQRVGCCLDLSVQNYALSDKKLSSYFSRVLAIFRDEIQQPKNIRPFPVLLGDGRTVDLSKLYFVVHEKGGYESVTVDKGWSSVSEALGFDSSVGSCLKLVYVKYLGGVEKWIRKLLVNNKEAAKQVCDLKVEVNGVNVVEDEAKGTPVLDAKKSHFMTSRDMERRLEVDDDEKGGKDVTKRGNQSSSKKRKRNELGEMLGWLLNLARSPLKFCGEKVSSEGVKGNTGHVAVQFYSQLLSARERRYLKRIRLTNGNIDSPSLQKHQKAHPSMYEDDMLRQSERLQSAAKPPSISLTGNTTTTTTKKSGKQKSKKPDPLSGIMVNLPQTEYKYQPVPISTKFQAKLPPLTSKSSYERTYSSKWLGSQIWPQENQKHNQFKHHLIGKGKANTCKCESRGSVRCTRLHVAERRLKLKNELGPAFRQWGFDRMGEAVALSWTERESEKFKEVVKSYVASPDNNLWDRLPVEFPSKERSELVSYYFNVFTLSRRSYQNRVTPVEINSDDDEEFGFLSIPYGKDAMKGGAPKPFVCVQNTQCVEFEDD